MVKFRVMSYAGSEFSLQAALGRAG